jgi:acyl-coenzyme A synthetase/AMP-(fatty) acid ligase
MPAYVAFTSGSTGDPKGVVVSHRAVASFVLGTREYLRQGPGERYLRLAPLGFDVSTLELFVALASGATLEVYPPGPVAPMELADWLTERSITVAVMAAGLFRLVALEAPSAFAGLTQLITGGEVVPAAQVRQVLARSAGEMVLTNGYGPTENTMLSTFHSMSRPEDVPDPVPIGRCVPWTSAVVVDDDLEPVADGEPGELCVTGPGLASGYLGDAERTARAFVTMGEPPVRVYRTGDLVRRDPDGTLFFLGRIDRQVKVRGHRIELGEVESAFRRLDGVTDAAVVGRRSEEALTLVGAVVTEIRDLDVSELREHLRRHLPEYMVPSVIAVVSSIPLTTNGKVDEAALVEMLTARPDDGEPPRPSGEAGRSDPTTPEDFERLLTELWAEVLGHHDFDSDEGFFDVGGDSLLAASLHTMLSERLPGIEVKVVDIFTFPTIEDLAVRLSTVAAR